MVQTCCVESCKNNSRRTRNSSIRYFSFPIVRKDGSALNKKLSKARHDIWQKIVNRPTFFKTCNYNNWRICSEHFVENERVTNLEILNVDWIPTLKLDTKLNWTDHVENFRLKSLMEEIKNLPAKIEVTEKIKNPKKKRSFENKSHSESDPETEENIKEEEIFIKCTLCMKGKENMINLKERDCAEEPLDIFFRQAENFYRTSNICGECLEEVERFYKFYSNIREIHDNVPLQTAKILIKDPFGDIRDNLRDEDSFEPQANKKKRKMYPCDTCDAQMLTPHSLKQHQERHNKPNPNDYTDCEVCRMPIQYQYVQTHMKLLHVDEKLPCDNCGGSFTAQALKGHVRICNLQPVDCVECGKRFKNKLVLRKHMFLHTGARKTKCEFCPKIFPVRYYAFRHEQKEHKEEYEKKYPFGRRVRLNNDNYKGNSFETEEAKELELEKSGDDEMEMTLDNFVDVKLEKDEN